MFISSLALLPAVSSSATLKIYQFVLVAQRTTLSASALAVVFRHLGTIRH